MFEVVRETSAVVAGVAQLAPIEYHSDRLGRLVCSHQQVYPTIFKTLSKGGLLVADNAISHQESLQPLLDRALTDERVDALIVPIGMGELVCRKV